MNIKYGNLQGRYFRQSAIDMILLPLAEELAERMIAASDFEIWYDARKDFYHLKFICQGKTFNIRYYKVLSVYIDDKEGWIVCPMSSMSKFVLYLKKESLNLN